MIVLDASAWIDALIGASDPPDPELALVAPPHFDAEVLGSIRALEQRGVLTTEAANQALHLHLSLDVEIVRHPDDVRQAWLWREHFSFADAWYIALATRLGVPWYTTDARAAKRARDQGVRVIEPAPRP